MGTLLRKLPALALLLAALSALAIILSGPGTKMGLWHFGFGIQLVTWSVYLGAAAAAVALLALLVSIKTRAGRGNALVALIVGGGIAGYIVSMVAPAQNLPPIHDITTDINAPLQFEAIVELRGKGSNSLDYASKKAPRRFGQSELFLVSELQSEAYPDIRPLQMDRPFNEVFDKAEALVRGRGWEVANASKEAGIIEATDETFWFGFKDDVIIAVTATDDGGSRVDMRSVSRVGQSDLGVNAARIEAFLSDLQDG